MIFCSLNIFSNYNFLPCRLTKEKGYYEKEAQKEQERYDKFKSEGADEHTLKKQVIDGRVLCILQGHSIVVLWKSDNGNQ